MSGIRLLIGLGNPGSRYAATRHNVGFWLADRVAAAHGGVFRDETRFHGALCRLTVADCELRLLKPTTFMNHSGRSVSALVRYFDLEPEALLVAYDELDLPVGQVRLKQGGGHAGHNGMRDVIAALGNRDFWRLRIGIGHPGDKQQVVNYVLNAPTKTEAEQLSAGLATVEQHLPALLNGEFQRVMNQLHANRESLA